MYTTMRADPCLCFLERAGRPDDKAIDAEQHTGDAELGDECVASIFRPLRFIIVIFMLLD